MSTTMPSASRSARRKVASMTYVAPWSRWAGPNTSPRKLWAIIMWSRTVTLNTGSPLAVGDRWAERRQAPGGQPRHDVGQLVEARLTGEERVEGGVTQQFERERQPVGRRAAPGAGRGHGADLARADAKAAGVERPAQRQRDLRVAVPAEVDHGALGSEQVERELEAGGRRAGVDDHVASVGGVGRGREVDAEGVRDVDPAGIDVHQRYAHAREPAEQTRDAASDHPGAHDRDAVTDERGGIPQGVDGGLDGAGQHGAIRRHALRHDRHG